MYIHQQDWASATRVAEQNDPAHVPEVLVAQAAVCVQRQVLPTPTPTLPLPLPQSQPQP